ncbi:hypothetical protein HPB48_005781 [Haemaphysalis longicornis]|uniref:Uncharacterized protein n=1 Tax=Haemaphysalis longicornis TaxID=44386 RepID=A0A9J6G815_HAELO|nr:hypothetical protein HPB48_005781 [Haemaphysalis longicornis]
MLPSTVDLDLEPVRLHLLRVGYYSGPWAAALQCRAPSCGLLLQLVSGFLSPSEDVRLMKALRASHEGYSAPNKVTSSPAKSRVEVKSLFVGVPSLGEDTPKSYMHLMGRILLAFMSVAILRLELSLLQMLQNLVAMALMVLVAVGYKTKLCTLTLVLWLTVVNRYGVDA